MKMIPAFVRRSGDTIRPPRRVVTLAAVLAATVAMAADASAAMTPEMCDTARVVAQAVPAIVNITVVKVTRAKEAAAEKAANEQVAVFVGSGAVIDPSGIIVTNKHVIQDAALIRVIFNDKTEVPAQLIAAASLVDLALLKVNLPKPLPTLAFADSDDARVGEPVIAVGDPLGLGTSVSTGVISALNRDLMRTPFDDFIQTDATINPGNSGGPLLDCAGNIVGVNTALLSNSKLLGSIGLGFALPSNDARFVAGRLREPEKARPTWIGLHLQDLTSDIAVTFGRPDTAGAIVAGVDPGSPGAQAALVPGDIVTAADGEPMSDARAILRAVLMKPLGEPIALSVWRQGQMIQATVRGQPWPQMMAHRSDVLASAASVMRAQAQGIGLHVTDITPAERRRFGLKDAKGVLIDHVTPGSQAESMGLAAGEVIQEMGMRPVTTAEDVARRLVYGDTEGGDLVPLLVHGKDHTRWIALYVGRVDVGDLVAVPPPGSHATARNASAALR
jgi:serine protease Do